MKPSTDSCLGILFIGCRGRTETGVREVLSAAGMSCSWRRIHATSGLAKALAARPDLVLLDGTGSKTECRQWLQRVRAGDTQVPFVVAGGPADEVRVVDALKAGASDYVSADKLERLPAVIAGLGKPSRTRGNNAPAPAAPDKHYEAFVALTRSPVWQSGDENAAIREITATVARTLGVERVSYWRLNPAGTAIFCQDLFETSRARHSAGMELRREDYPDYFKALAANEVIPAEDARRDRRTREFAKSYLGPLGITSMLDAPVLVGGALAGVLCSEQVGPRRRWTPAERNLAVSAASLLSLLIARLAQARSESHLRMMVENEPACVKVVSAEGRLLEMNPAGLRMIEAGDGREVFDHPVLDLVHPDDRKSFLALHRRVLKGETGDLRFRIIGRQGTLRWMETHSAPMPDASGRITGVLSVTHDVTQRLRDEADLARHAQQQELLARLSVEAMRSAEMGDILQKATEWVARIMAVPLGKVLRWDGANGWFELVAGTAGSAGWWARPGWRPERLRRPATPCMNTPRFTSKTWRWKPGLASRPCWRITAWFPV